MATKSTKHEKLIRKGKNWSLTQNRHSGNYIVYTFNKLKKSEYIHATKKNAEDQIKAIVKVTRMRLL